jgi:hypothetical protein
MNSNETHFDGDSREPQTAAESRTEASVGIHPMVQCSQDAFRRALPGLLQNKHMYRRWIAYHGDERIGIAKSANELLKECARRGLKEHEYFVRCIVPEILPQLDSTPLYDA